MTAYLTVEDVLEAHARLIGPDLVREPGQVAASVHRPSSGFGETEFYPSAALKAAALLHGFATTQAFVDGNKRMAVYTSVAFLLINGYALTLDDDEMYELTMATSQGRMTLEEVAERLELALQRLDLE